MFYRLLSVCLTACLLSPFAQADQLTAAKTADIKRLMEATGSSNIARQFAGVASRQIFGALKQSRPETPDRVQGVIEGELLSLFSARVGLPGGLVEQMVPVYAKHYTHDEVKELLRFYQTPLGKKTLSAQPLAAAENMQVSQRWVQSLAPEIDKRVTDALRKEGIAPMPPAGVLPPPAATPSK